jgi:GTP cyclohydrolase II
LTSLLKTLNVFINYGSGTFLGKLNQEVKADRTYAQILTKITPSSKNLEEAKEMIEDFGIKRIDLDTTQTKC